MTELFVKMSDSFISNFTSNAIALDKGVLGYGTQGNKPSVPVQNQLVTEA